MKTAIIVLLVAMIATPAMARKECKPYIKKYLRGSNGSNRITVGWQCTGSGNGDSIVTADICGVTENNTVVCAKNWKRLSIDGRSITLDFNTSQYQIERLFIKR